MIKQQGSDPSSSHHDLALVKLTLILMLAPFASTFSYSFMATNRSNALIKDKKVNTEDNWSQAIDKTTKNNKYIWWTSEVHYIKKTLVQLLLSAGLDMSSAFSSSHLSEAANANNNKLNGTLQNQTSLLRETWPSSNELWIWTRGNKTVGLKETI